MSLPESKSTQEARQKYNRNARFYNQLELPMEWLFYRRWRKLLFSRLTGENVLEVGLGTGKNLPFYANNHFAIAAGIDLSEGMLAHARPQAAKRHFALIQADAQALPFASGRFDTVIATFVFCSVPDPILGLREIHRVLKQDGQLLLLEHVLPSNPVLARVFNALNPITVRKAGVNINRRTAENLLKAGFELDTEKDLLFSIFKLFIALPKPG